MLIEKERATSDKFLSSPCPALLALVGMSNFPISHVAKLCKCTAHPFRSTTHQGIFLHSVFDPPTCLFFDLKDNQRCWQPGQTYTRWGSPLLRGMLFSVYVPVTLVLEHRFRCSTRGIGVM